VKKILVALDGSSNSTRGLAKAIEIAKEDQSKIIGVNIVEVPMSYFISRPKMEIKSKLTQSSKKILDGAKTRCLKAGVSFESKTVPGGDAGYDIVKFSKKQKVDMIVIGARGLNPLKEMFLGSVSNYVLHKSKIPVLIVK
jgi:nucleotide-binding universal stress UspA family protein